MKRRILTVLVAALAVGLGATACGPEALQAQGEGTSVFGESIEPTPPDPGTTVVVPPEPPAPPPPSQSTPTVDLTQVTPTVYTLKLPPSVTIELPYNGWQPAPNGSVKIPFHGWATDSTGAAIPGTRLRWTAVEDGKTTVLCAGSDFGPPPTGGGIVTVTNCSQFQRTFYNHSPRGGSGPSITIKLEAKDQGGLVGSAEVIIALYTPPN